MQRTDIIALNQSQSEFHKARELHSFRNNASFLTQAFTVERNLGIIYDVTVAQQGKNVAGMRGKIEVSSICMAIYSNKIFFEIKEISKEIIMYINSVMTRSGVRFPVLLIPHTITVLCGLRKR